MKEQSKLISSVKTRECHDHSSVKKQNKIKQNYVLCKIEWIRTLKDIGTAVRKIL